MHLAMYFRIDEDREHNSVDEWCSIRRSKTPFLHEEGGSVCI